MSSGSGDAVAYVYRPSLLGAPWEFKLTGDGIAWVTGRRSGHIPFRDVRRLRMSFKPGNMQSQCFVTEIWAEGAPKLAIASASWKSMFQQERQDLAYVAFIAELHRRLALAAVPVRFEQGRHPVLYWPSVAVLVGVSLASAFLIMRALQAQSKGGALFIAVFLGLFLWQGGNFVARNRPGLYSPDALPAQVMPKR